MSLLKKLTASTTIKETAPILESDVFNGKDNILTDVPAVNIALSGTLTGGLTSGLTIWAGPSKHFKTMFSLLMAKAYLDKHKDGVMLFYDSEFGTPPAYFESFGIDMTRVIHTPITNIEQLRTDLSNQLNAIDKKDKVIIVVDSVGNLASAKEIKDAEEGNSAADMTRAKILKSLFRIATPILSLKDIPMVVVNHTYQTMEMYSKSVVSGGTGVYYSADNIYIIGRQQEKEGKDVVGYNFIINVEKSRYALEKSKIPVNVTKEHGINKWSGLLEIALAGGFVIKPSNGWYSKVNTESGEVEDKKFRAKETNTSEFWDGILNSKPFADYVEKTDTVARGSIIEDDEIDDFITE
jgi:RecA/RadA recombinase